MKGDFTRRSYYDLKKPYTGVLKQQGRVDLDADWNDQVAIQDHLRHTALMDLIGRCGVPYPSQTAPEEDGFRIDMEFTGAGEPILKLAAGRIYVDGMLCELADDLAQTYYPDENGLWTCEPKEELECDLRLPDGFTPAVGQTDLLYLEVWQRHVTAVEDPDIREEALGGPDTTTRVETLWQLKLEPEVSTATDTGTKLPACEDAIKDWPPAESGGLLSASVVVGSEQPTGHCDIGAEGGYRGLENRLYLIEIHEGGKKDQATFKWSRDNGSVVYGVKDKISDKTVRLEHLGRDRELSLKEGDWVEILDDKDEFAFQGSKLAKITDIDLSNTTVTLSESIPKDVTQHLRLRRWDQGKDAINVNVAWREQTEAILTDVITQKVTPAASYELENGITIWFSGDNFKAGDYWVFPARTATGAIKELKDEAPHGIERHYCKLALLTWSQVGSNGEVDIQDCRQTFPPLTELTPMAGCCTVRVGRNGEFSSLQTAISSLGSTGGRVCLLPGDHDLRATVHIDQNNLTIVGCGRHARIFGPSEGPAFLVEGSHDIRFEDLWVETASLKGVMRINRTEDIVISDCRMLNTDGNRSLSIQSDGVHITSSMLKGGVWIRDGSSDVRIDDNQISDGKGAGVTLCGREDDDGDGAVGVVSVTVHGNRIRDMDNSGIASLAPPGDLEGLVIVNNLISNCARQGPQPPYHDKAIGGIVLREAEDVRIQANTIIDNGTTNGVSACGVFADECQGLVVERNTIRNNGLEGSALGGTKAATAWQAGIVGLNLTGPAAERVERRNLGRPGDSAARVHDNIVSCPSGHTLVLAGMGQFSVANNTLTTYGLRAQPLEGTELACAVIIANWGVSSDLAGYGFLPRFGEDTRLRIETAAAEIGTPRCVQPKALLPTGRVLFHGNQLTLHVAESSAGLAFSAAGFLSFDDLSLQDNQFVQTYSGGMLVHVVALAATVRSSGNRFTELPFCASYSYFSWGLLNTAIGNQATHCLSVHGGRIYHPDEKQTFSYCPNER